MTPKFDLTEAERLALAYLAREELRTNRYPLSPQLGPLKSALAKLDPLSDPPAPPVSPRRKNIRR